MKKLVKLTALLSLTVLTGCYVAKSPNLSINSSSGESGESGAKEYVLSGDFLFDFDKSDLSSEGQTMLGNIAKEIKAADAKFVVIAGYTDPLGSDEYNLKLSQERADAAKSYLQEQGIDVNITAIGRGKASQIKACDDVPEAELKECLKPNRRVVIRAE